MKAKPKKARVRIAIAAGRFNEEITSSLLGCCVDELRAAGVPRTSVDVVWVPGAYELPFAAQRLAKSRRYDAIICLGCVIKGETAHDTFVASWAAIGIGQVSLSTGVPTLFGVLTTKNESQALHRARPGPLNRGQEIAKAALEMIEFNRKGTN